MEVHRASASSARENMDTITRQKRPSSCQRRRSWIIDRGFRPGEIQPQVKEVTAIKRTQHGITSDPHTILLTLCEALAKMEDTRVGVLVVVDSRSASRWTLYAMAALALGEPLRGVVLTLHKHDVPNRCPDLFKIVRTCWAGHVSACNSRSCSGIRFMRFPNPNGRTGSDCL